MRWAEGAGRTPRDRAFVALLLALGPARAGSADAYNRLREQSAQLVESRTRIVEVADAARRSLERDLHDGAQQRLQSALVQLALTRRLAAAGLGVFYRDTGGSVPAHLAA